MDLDSRKQRLFNDFISDMDETYFNHGLRTQIDENGEGNFLGFTNYNDFVNFQEQSLKNADENTINTLEFLRYNLVQKAATLNDDMNLNFFAGIVLNAYGRVIFVESQ